MGDWSNAALQTVFWNCANAMRREAKLCDIVLYVQNRHGMMVGYPAHKLLLISTSKYFKLLFEREDLRNSCHFPHLNEDGLICVLDIIYGRDISKGVNLDDALMAARFLQVELAVEALEKKMAEDSFSKDKHLSDVKPATLSKPQSRTNNQQQPANVAEVRLFKNLKVTAAAVEDTKQCVKRRKVGTTPESDSFSDSQLTPDTETNQSQGDIITIKMEPDLNLTADDTGSYQGYDHPLSQMSFTQGGEEMADDGEMQNYGMASTDDIDEQDMSFSNQMTNQGFVADTNSTGSVPGCIVENAQNVRCDICGQVMSRRSIYKHKRLHTGEMPYKCNVCDKKFREIGNLYKHMRRHHGNVNLFCCSYCGISFESSVSLKSHRVECWKIYKQNKAEEAKQNSEKKC